MTRTSKRCDYVIRRAGYSVDGRPVALDGAGDVTQTCKRPGTAVPHIYHTKRPGTTAVYEMHEATAIRCREHADRP